ncbi:MAG: GNAT family N-acetyltransferase [Treponema sp.]|nr:GNAT family N-acetyltransferase [Treponema sp.]
MEEFRLARPDEAGKIYSLLLEKAEWFQQRGIQQWDAEYIERNINENRILETIDDKKYYILKQDDQITAACILDDIDINRQDNDENSKFIQWLTSKGRGAGGRLIKFLIQHCKEQGIQRLRLDCQDHNQKLKHYYFDLGFKQVGRKPHKFFLDRYSCLMELEIKHQE